MDQENLSQELIDKAKGCASTEEVVELLQTEGYELSDELVETIAGGLALEAMVACLAGGDIVARRPLDSDRLAGGNAGGMVLSLVDRRGLV